MAITLNKMKELLQVNSLPGNPETIKELLGWAEEIIQKKGEKYITNNRHRLLQEWEFIVQNS